MPFCRHFFYIILKLKYLGTYSWHKGSSKQSVLIHPRSGGGEVWSGPVVQVGKQGSDIKCT